MGSSSLKKKSLSRVQLFATPWTAAYQAPLSVGLSRQEYWSGVPSPSPKYEQSYPKLIPCAFGGNEGLGYKSCSELLTKPDNRIILHPIIFSALGPVQFCLETWLQMNLWDHFVLSGWSQKRNDPQNFYALILLNCGYILLLLKLYYFPMTSVKKKLPHTYWLKTAQTYYLKIVGVKGSICILLM